MALIDDMKYKTIASYFCILFIWFGEHCTEPYFRKRFKIIKPITSVMKCYISIDCNLSQDIIMLLIAMSCSWVYLRSNKNKQYWNDFQIFFSKDLEFTWSCKINILLCRFPASLNFLCRFSYYHWFSMLVSQ